MNQSFFFHLKMQCLSNKSKLKDKLLNILSVVIIFEWYSHISTMSRNDMFFIYVIAKFSFLLQPF